MTKPVRDQERRTPPWFFKRLELWIKNRSDSRFKFILDAAASSINALCRKFFSLDDGNDGLALPWRQGTFCNPPFAHFGDWIKKAYEEAAVREIVVCVVGPVGCSQKWFHLYAKRGTVLVPNERITFYDSKTGKPTRGADRDTNVYIFGPGFWNTQHNTKWLHLELDVAGQVIRLKKTPAKKTKKKIRKKAKAA